MTVRLYRSAQLQRQCLRWQCAWQCVAPPAERPYTHHRPPCRLLWGRCGPSSTAGPNRSLLRREFVQLVVGKDAATPCIAIIRSGSYKQAFCLPNKLVYHSSAGPVGGGVRTSFGWGANGYETEWQCRDQRVAPQFRAARSKRHPLTAGLSGVANGYHRPARPKDTQPRLIAHHAQRPQTGDYRWIFVAVALVERVDSHQQRLTEDAQRRPAAALGQRLEQQGRPLLLQCQRGDVAAAGREPVK
jgi:hypothetical protein